MGNLGCDVLLCQQVYGMKKSTITDWYNAQMIMYSESLTDLGTVCF